MSSYRLTKNSSILTLKNCSQVLPNMVWGSKIGAPRSGIRKKLIPDPDPGRTVPDPGYRIRIRNLSLKSKKIGNSCLLKTDAEGTVPYSIGISVADPVPFWPLDPVAYPGGMHRMHVHPPYSPCASPPPRPVHPPLSSLKGWLWEKMRQWATRKNARLFTQKHTDPYPQTPTLVYDKR